MIKTDGRPTIAWAPRIPLDPPSAEPPKHVPLDRTVALTAAFQELGCSPRQAYIAAFKTVQAEAA